MTGISWTDRVWNPTTGCDRLSDGCDHCYALTMAKRLKGMGQVKYQRDGDPRTSGPGFGIAMHPDALNLPLTWRKPQRVFVNSMSDLFHDGVSDEFIDSVFATMADCPQHTFQLLTKRHARMRSYLSRTWPDPLPNVWVGASVEDQPWARIRIDALVRTPAAVRFLSCEPLLSGIDLRDWMPEGGARWQCGACRRFYGGSLMERCPGCGAVGYWSGSHAGNGRPNGQPIGWVIVGGESGPRARPCDEQWVRTIAIQSVRAGVPVFVKQMGKVWAQRAGVTGDSHGADWDHWPVDLREREFPAEPARAAA